MTAPVKNVRRPRITIIRTDADKLALLAATMSDRVPDVAETLLAEIDRAHVVADSKARDDIVRMGSAVRYSVLGGGTRDVTLVYPGEADIAQGKVSVMTPIGAALLGLSAGQSISWKARDGREHVLTVQSVHAAAVHADEPLPEHVLA